MTASSLPSYLVFLFPFSVNFQALINHPDDTLEAESTLSRSSFSNKPSHNRSAFILSQLQVFFPSQNSCCTSAPQREILHFKLQKPWRCMLGFIYFWRLTFYSRIRMKKQHLKSLRLQLPNFFFKCISRLTVNNLLNKYINMKGEAKLHLCDITMNQYFKIQ